MVAFATIMFWPAGLKGDQKDVLATLGRLANDKLSAVSTVRFLLNKGGSPMEREFIEDLIVKHEALDFGFESFRERGPEGKGIKCAAIAYVKLGPRRSFEFSTEYSVEPTSDGKSIVSAKFVPN